MKRKIRFIFEIIWRNNRKLFFSHILQIPIFVILPYLTLFLTKALIEGIEKQYALHTYLIGILFIFLLQLGLTGMRDWLDAAANWRNSLFINDLLGPIDQKTMDTDYANVEGMTGQKSREKALNAAYVSGQRAMSRFVSFSVNFLGLILYGATVGACNGVILLTVIATSCGGYLLSKLRRKYELEQKEAVIKCENKMRYLENEAVSLQAAREIRLYDMSGLMDELYRKHMEDRIRLADRISRVKLLISGGGSLLSFIRNFAAYFYLIHLASLGQITAADFILMIGLASKLSVWLGGVMDDIGEIRKMSMYLEDYFAYLDLPDGTDGCAEGIYGKHMHTSGKSPELKFEGVCFRYEGAEEDALKDIRFTIKPGEKLAIVGRNGAGKTTLIKLLSGLYHPDRGRVLLDGEDITGYGKEAYFRAISAVFQDIVLLPVSILQNVSSHTYERTDKEKVKKSLDMAGIYEKAARLPQGMDTPMQKTVREDGVDLSGGEQQKVMLAKAVYKDARILILDEPTAALDPVAENNIYQKYGQLAQGMTSLFISHRLASTSFCDNIILIDGGRIIEQGSHKELMEAQGEYWKMYTLQSHYYDSEEHRYG